MGFLLHFDNRLGVGDHGPYHLDDGGFVLARDIFVSEPAFPWSDGEGLPYAFTVAMFFAPDSGLEVEMMDISTVFTTPANYLPFVQGVAVYRRDTWDAPVEEIRTVGLDDMAELRTRLEERAAALYQRIAAMSKRERIESGAMVYTAGFALPFARAAGMYDELVAEHDFHAMHPAVSACYDTIISGVATEMIPRLFLTGSWGNPVPEQVSDELSGDDAELPVLHALKVRGFAGADAVAESSGLDEATVQATLDTVTERGHAKLREGRISGYALTPAGSARHVLLLRDSVPRATVSRLASVYESFLAPNREFKQLTSDWQQGSGDGTLARLEAVHGEVGGVIERAAAEQPRFATYQGRFDRALEAFRGGDDDALAKPLSGSYHDVWMELHEDLLATLGRERSDADE